MRICSLMPGATEIVAALGLADSLVGVSHECDYPPSIRRVPVMLRSVIDPDTASSGEIDRQVRESVARGQSLYVVDEDALVKAAPEVVLMQEICDVCAITPAGIQTVLARLARPPRIVPLSATSMGSVIADIVTIGEVVGRRAEAARLVETLRERLAALQRRVAGRSRPGVLCIEWLDPPYVAGHWVPEMIELAGGGALRGKAAEASYPIAWPDVIASQPDIIVFAPCGFTIERTMRELGDISGVTGWDRIPAVRHDRVFVVEAGAYFSRPGPRLIDGAELLAQLFHPAVFGPALPAGAHRVGRHAWSAG